MVKLPGTVRVILFAFSSLALLLTERAEANRVGSHGGGSGGSGGGRLSGVAGSIGSHQGGQGGGVGRPGSHRGSHTRDRDWAPHAREREFRGRDRRRGHAHAHIPDGRVVCLRDSDSVLGIERPGQPLLRDDEAVESGESVHLDLYAAGQRVKDSDGSTQLGARVGVGPIALALRNSHYFESQGGESTRMNVFSMSINARLIGTDRTDLWLEGGFGSVDSSDFHRLFGAMIGLELEHRFTPQLAVVGGARHFSFNQELKARELRAGVRAGILQVGYRHLQFNVGLPLEGPEAGLALRF